jgi:hypothetical protein
MIRDVFAAVIAALLLYLAVRMATTLTYYRRQRQRARDSERALGRTVIVEIPGDEDLVLFSEDRARFYYGDRSIDKDLIQSVRLLINANTIAEAHRGDHPAAESPVDIHDQPEGIARDRWDVAIEAINGTTVVECGAIRERVSQELARAVFDAVKRSIDPPHSGPQRGYHSASGTPPR